MFQMIFRQLLGASSSNVGGLFSQAELAGHEIWKSINIQIVFLSLCKIHDYTLFYERFATVLIYTQNTKKSLFLSDYFQRIFLENWRLVLNPGKFRLIWGILVEDNPVCHIR